MNTKISARVSDAIHQIFQPDVHEEASALLSEYQNESVEGRDRIHLDILKLCEGQLKKLRTFVDLAKIDYRDVIVAAEYDNVNGKCVPKSDSPKD
jgi:hypothetical protein